MSPREQANKAYYEEFFASPGEPPEEPFHKFFWRGVDVVKCADDAWALHEIIVETRPDIVLETGTAQGGSALFMADTCNLVGHGEVVSIDVTHAQIAPLVKAHPRITLLLGNSGAPSTYTRVVELCRGKRTMVVLDSDHSAAHVLAELRAYAPLVTPGLYLVVEDTNLNGHPVMPHGPGPREALDEYLRDHGPEWRVDHRREKFITFNPGGYLVRL